MARRIETLTTWMRILRSRQTLAPRLWRWLPVLFLTVPGLAPAKETLAWSVFNFPPFQILEGPHKGSGSFDGELQTLMTKLPEYEHRIVPMSFARRREEFQAGTNICTPGIFRAPAAALNLALSVPLLTHLDNRVVFLKKTTALAGNDPIDLDALLERKNLVAAFVPGRSYAPNIDASIQRHRNASNIVTRALDTSQAFRMLLAGDIDYMLLFSHEAAFLADTFNAGDLIANRRIAGTPPYIFTHVACTGNEWGHSIIRRINEIMASERGKPEYRKFSERWYPPEDQEKVRGHYPAMLKETQ